MKKLFTLILILSFFGVSNALANIRLKDSLKIVHPVKSVADDKVRMILFAMGQRDTDEEKVAAFKQNIKDKGLKVVQLQQLLNQFSLDKWKLECAMYAYPNLVDYKSFLDLSNLFDGDQFKDKLAEFYKKNKKRSS